MDDRDVQYPGRIKLTPVPGQQGAYDVTPLPGKVYNAGTYLNKRNLLQDNTAALYGLGRAAVPDDVFKQIHTNFLDIPNHYFYQESLAAYTKNGSWRVPSGVSKVRVWGCAAGANYKAGEYIIAEVLPVTPGSTINFDIGMGDTVISGVGINRTLAAGYTAESLNCNIFGFITGTTAERNDRCGANGAGGTYGYGGAGGGNIGWYWYDSNGRKLQSSYTSGGCSIVSVNGLMVRGGAAGISRSDVNGKDGTYLANKMVNNLILKLLPNFAVGAGSGGGCGAMGSSSGGKLSPSGKGGTGGGAGGGEGGKGGATGYRDTGWGGGGGGGAAGGYGAAGGAGGISDPFNASSNAGESGKPGANTGGFLLFAWG